MIVIYYYQDWKRTNELLKSFKIEIDPTEIQKDKINIYNKLFIFLNENKNSVFEM